MQNGNTTFAYFNSEDNQGENENQCNTPCSTKSIPNGDPGTSPCCAHCRNSDVNYNKRMGQEEIVNVNVGGVVYTTSRSTLLRYPDSMLGAMFSGTMPTTRDNKGNYFIDRDGVLFRYVLNFLRSGDLSLPENFIEFSQLLKEADFFQIKPLLDCLHEMTKQEEPPPPPKEPSSGGFYLEIKESAAHSIQIIGPQGPNESTVQELLPKELIKHNTEKSKWGAKGTSGQSTRLMYGSMLLQAGWKFVCLFIRSDNTIIEKWFLAQSLATAQQTQGTNTGPDILYRLQHLSDELSFHWPQGVQGLIVLCIDPWFGAGFINGIIQFVQLDQESYSQGECKHRYITSSSCLHSLAYMQSYRNSSFKVYVPTTMSGYEIVNLNVGGVIYTTTIATLTKYPESMLGAMFSGNMPTAHDDRGNYFIDRDGSMFRHILNFLRSGQLDLPEDFKEHKQLQREADFYQIQPLLDILRNRQTNQGGGYFLEIKENSQTNRVTLLGPKGPSSGDRPDILPTGLRKHNNESRWGFTPTMRLLYGAILQKSGWTLVCVHRDKYSICEKWYLPMRMSEDLVHLNIGGVHFTTTKSTLTRYADSMLGAMFSGAMATTVDEKGHYFIDRDGDIFRYILNFLRSSRLSLPEGFKDLDLLAAEADFYQIQPMIQAVNDYKKKHQQATCTAGCYLEVVEIRTGSTATMPTNNARVKTIISGRKDLIMSLPLTTTEGQFEKLQNCQASDFIELELNGSNIRLKLAEHLQNSGWTLTNANMSSSSGYDTKSIVSSLMIEHSYRDRWFFPQEENMEDMMDQFSQNDMQQ
ncbi:uncharacterized protein LOC106171442 [Lingula anatina]|uniref:Uncharacterized protein LOC106171442 n=1 Tax=Lingula anatina TaxID=7574 RepID=A0A2R2MN10_LINAN|nr:uncharacterized protein LOC106171442 [Lingula anatina]|eukprot:XP_023931584.1 uncharacterized protein LOC106171442 [Lingula anatina]